MTAETKFAHTPGPLRTRQAGEVIEIVAGEGWDTHLVATVPALSNRRHADAVLFAASPDMAEAIELFLANEVYHGIGGRQDVYDRQYERAVGRLSAALRKARGES